jgi:hypothetical protein
MSTAAYLRTKKTAELALGTENLCSWVHEKLAANNTPSPWIKEEITPLNSSEGK